MQHVWSCNFLSCVSKQVARIKLGERAATEIGDCLKAKSASRGRTVDKAPVNFGPKPPSGLDNKKVRSKTNLNGGNASHPAFIAESACGRGEDCEGENRSEGDQFGEGGSLVEGG